MCKFDQKGLRNKVNIYNDPQRRPWENQLGQEKIWDKSFQAFISGKAHYKLKVSKAIIRLDWTNWTVWDNASMGGGGGQGGDAH